MKSISFLFQRGIGYTFIAMVACAVISCGPLIHSFTVTPLTIVKDDSVKLNWSVRGTATLLVHTDTAEEGQPEIREYMLVVRKKDKEVKREVQVIVLPETSADDIVFNVTRRADTLVAKDEKNIERWGTSFILKTVSAVTRRALTVTHDGKTIQLAADGPASILLDGSPNSGDWEIKSPLTPSEIKDSTLIPSRIKIHTVIFHKK